ncbi:jg2021 [Pararge aegeria aegeria]|uniref:Anoctamin n=1 Tax=Pararge aegeria aegeria TaxID=348720 RepID=A0A8S4S6G1_9NEOP|nr:jg2021 [Pararge aegeria aegeria]
MGSQCQDMELRLRMKMVKCERFKTFQSEPTNKKFFDNELGSMHQLKLLSDENDRDKATQADFPVPVEQEQREVEEEEEEQQREEVKEERKKKAKEVGIAKQKEEITEKQEAKVEEVRKEEVTKVEEEEIPEIIKINFALFRDEVRRIDMVLVVHDDATSKKDRLKLDFVTNILRTGLEIEIEPGLMPIHKHLCFIKIHAPDCVLNEYGKVFAVRRFFVDNRLQLMGASNKNILDKIRNIFRFRYYKNHEMEWLKIIRSNYTTPDGYSYYERSIIVYKILRHLPFGDYANQYGIHRLLKRNIILDAYALHDGPYFYAPRQTPQGSNGRQILFYNWAGLHNLFQSQPIHLIQEYFGPKIAFYYTFYEFYNAALILPSIAGVVSILMRYADVNKKEVDALERLVCKKKLEYDMCPECDSNVTLHYGVTFTRCYMRPMKDYCTSMKINGHLDHPSVNYYSIVIMLWVMVFVSLWRRKEYVLNWMWEVGGHDSYYKTSTRPEFEIDYTNPRRSARTAMKYDESGYYKVIRIFAPIVHAILCFLGSMILMDELKMKYDNFSNSFETTEKKPKLRDYYIMAMFQAGYTLLMSVVEALLHNLYYIIVDLENHKSLEAYERSLVKKQFELSYVLIFSFMGYYGWTVGRQLQYRGRCQWNSFLPLRKFIIFINHYIRTPWTSTMKTKGQDCRRYCWPFTCIIELSILLIVMLFLKEVVFRIIFNVYRTVTDYNEARKINKTIPCWEREYKLKEFNEATLTRKYMHLAVQFSLVTFFVVAFPLAPLVVLIINVWDIRHSATTLLLASRRPHLIRGPGIGAWSNVFVFLAYAAVIFNILTLAFTTKMAQRYFLQSNDIDVIKTFDLVLYPAIIYYDYAEIQEMKCTQYFLRRYLYSSPPGYPNYYLLGTRPPRSDTLALEYYIFIKIELEFLFRFLTCMLGIAVIIQYFVLSRSRKDVEKTMDKEKKIKNLYAHYNYVENKK